MLSTTLVTLCAWNPVWALQTIFFVFLIAAVFSMLIKEELRVQELEMQDQ